jgi:pyrroloquinoline-quinone synthase
MSLELQPRLESTLEDRQLLRHPFYQRWEAGELERSELTHYAEQYRFFEQKLPEFLQELAHLAPDGDVRDAVLSNLADEVTSPSHLELFDKFAGFYDAHEVPISPAMRALVDSYDSLLDDGTAAALAGLWAYESQASKIAESKADGLARHYGSTTDALAFWTLHGSLEVDHATWTLDALRALDPDPIVATRSARVIADRWWEFLDERELAFS